MALAALQPVGGGQGVSAAVSGESRKRSGGEASGPVSKKGRNTRSKGLAVKQVKNPLDDGVEPDGDGAGSEYMEE